MKTRKQSKKPAIDIATAKTDAVIAFNDWLEQGASFNRGDLTATIEISMPLDFWTLVVRAARNKECSVGDVFAYCIRDTSSPLCELADEKGGEKGGAQ